MQTFDDILGIDESKLGQLLCAVLDSFLTGGYFQRYDERIRLLNAGQYVGGYEDFVKANTLDAMATLGATVATAGIGTKLMPLAGLAKTSGQKILANAQIGGTMGYAYNVFEQMRDLAIGVVTEGVSGRTQTSLSEAFVMGGFGSVLGGGVSVVGNAASSLSPAAMKLIDDFFYKQSQTVGRDAPRAKSMGVKPEIVNATRVKSKVTAQVLFTTPAARSLTFDSASKLYMSELSKISSMIRKEATPEQQAIEAWDLVSAMRGGVLASLRDPRLKTIFEQRYALETVDVLEQRFKSEGVTGTEVSKKIVAMLTNPKEACFPAGTDVWTDQGLVPIEKLKVGDLVLSQDEGTGERAFKHVTQVFFHQNQPILRLWYTSETEDESVLVTPNHPVWVDGVGWLEIQQTRPYMEVVLAEDARGWITSWQTAYQWTTDQKTSWPKDFWLYDVWKDVSWPSGMPEGESSVTATPGFLEDKYSEKVPFETDVFNIEVEDFHTYFVGGLGLLVHNKNQVGVKLFNGKGALPPQDTPIYYSLEEMKADLPNLRGRGFVLLPRVLNRNEEMDAKPFQINENQVFGKLWDGEGVHFEVAVLYQNANQAESNHIFYEGFEIAGNALRAIDRKRQLFLLTLHKPGMTSGPGITFQQSILDELWRGTQALEQHKMAGSSILLPLEKISISLETPADFEYAKKYLIDPILSEGFGEVAIRKYDKRTVVNEKTGKTKISTYWPEFHPESDARLGAIQSMLREGKIEFVISDLKNQMTTKAGLTASTSLTQTQLDESLIDAKSYWLAIGASDVLSRSAIARVGESPAAVAGQTIGRQITLSPNGAGWGWFIDTTPETAEEFTWIGTGPSYRAMPSTGAEGQLDLLTVLIHELGHVLGLPLDDDDDVMGLVLDSGMCCLPDAQEAATLLATMPQLMSSNPILVPCGGSAATPWSGQINPELGAGATQWNTRGAVTFADHGNGTQGNTRITLSEAPNAQTSLMQAFNLGAQDRYLSFTVDGRDLNGGNSAGNTGPADALEVALLDPTTDSLDLHALNAQSNTVSSLPSMTLPS